nr:MAG TPA: hypothetical protein [Caudoviricetes sp.]
MKPQALFVFQKMLFLSLFRVDGTALPAMPNLA